jgi:hypothetical protein
MTPTPRTDAAIAASDGQWSFVLRDLAQELERELAESTESLAFQTQLNREVIELEKKTFAELAAEREQITILRSDEKRLVGFTKTYRLRADEAEAKLEQERQDRRQAELDVCRALGERNDAKAELASLKATIADPDEVELAMIRGEIAIPDRAEFDAIRETPVGYNPSPTDAEIDAHLDECVARSAIDWKEDL